MYVYVYITTHASTDIHIEETNRRAQCSRSPVDYRRAPAVR